MKLIITALYFLFLFYNSVVNIGCSNFILEPRTEKMRDLPQLTEEEVIEVHNNNRQTLNGLWCQVKGVFCVEYTEKDKYSFLYKDPKTKTLKPAINEQNVFFSSDSVFSITNNSKDTTFIHRYTMTTANDTTRILFLKINYSNGYERSFYKWL